MRGTTSPISRVNDAREELAKAWVMEIIERTPVSELGGIGLDWIAREAPPLIASILGALSEPTVAADRELGPSELRHAGEIRNLRTEQAAPALVPRDLASLQSILIEAIRREVPERDAGEFARWVTRLAEVFGAIQGAVVEDLVRERSGHAARDDATGLPGPAELHEWIRVLTSGEQRIGDGFTLMVFEVGGLRTIADAYGETASERMLAAVVDVVVGEIRPVDRTFRLDTDQLACLLPQQGPLPTLALAERLATLIDSSQADGGPRVAISIGIASCPEHANKPDTLLAAAEQAAYAAQAAGEPIAIASSARGLVGK
jgi:diguanylate cyclase (GGDEF)-like protein